MSLFLDGHRTVLAQYGFSNNGPYLTVNDIDAELQYYVPVRGTTLSLKRLPQRFCTGRIDLRTFESSVCPLKVELLPTEKDDICPACQEATGFNPSFYFAETISPQQREYNLTPHFVYLAYFSPQHIKAGISSETRGIGRLLEQGARACRIVGRFANADEARGLEAALCSQQSILETMRASLKARLLVEERFDANEAFRILNETAAQLKTVPEVAAAGFSDEEPPHDLSPFYFGGPSPDVDRLIPAEGHDSECAGKCIGMVGGVILLAQGDFAYATSLKEWESHVIELRENEITVEYNYDPQQMSLL